MVGDRDKRVHYEIFCCGYISERDELSLPNFLVHLPSQNYVIMDIDVEEELNERVNSVDLDDVGDNARYFDDTMREVKLERSRVLLVAEGIDQADKGGMNSMLLLLGDTMDPDEVKVPKSPYDWVDPDLNISRGG